MNHGDTESTENGKKMNLELVSVLGTPSAKLRTCLAVRYAPNRLLKNTVRADPSTPGAARLTLRMNGLVGVRHGVEACKPLIDLRPVFRLRFPESILSVVEGLNTNGLRGVSPQGFSVLSVSPWLIKN